MGLPAVLESSAVGGFLRKCAIRPLNQLQFNNPSPLETAASLASLFKTLSKDTNKKLKHAFKPSVQVAWSEIHALALNASFANSPSEAHSVLTSMARMPRSIVFPSSLVLKIAKEGLRASLADGDFRCAARLCSLVGAISVSHWPESEFSEMQEIVKTVAEQLPTFLAAGAALPESLGCVAEICWKFQLISDKLQDILADEIQKDVHFQSLAILQISRFFAISGFKNVEAWRAIARRVREISEDFTARDFRLLLENFAFAGLRDRRVLSEICARLEEISGQLSFDDCVVVVESLGRLEFDADRKFLLKLHKRMQTSVLGDVRKLPRLDSPTLRVLLAGSLSRKILST